MEKNILMPTKPTKEEIKKMGGDELVKLVEKTIGEHLEELFASQLRNSRGEGRIHLVEGYGVEIESPCPEIAVFQDKKREYRDIQAKISFLASLTEGHDVMAFFAGANDGSAESVQQEMNQLREKSSELLAWLDSNWKLSGAPTFDIYRGYLR